MKLFCSCDHDLEALRGQVEKLSQQCAEEKRRGGALAQDFEELQDKVYRWMQRTLKRDRDAQPATPAGDETASPASPHHLHPTVARIMARRQRRMNGLPAPLPSDG